MLDRYDELYRSFRWNVPPRYNIARACCAQWAVDRSRFALYWEDEAGASAPFLPSYPLTLLPANPSPPRRLAA